MSQRTDKDCACSEKDKGRKFLEEICVNFTSASSPTMNGKMPHIQCTADDVGEIVLLPGDPARVSMFEDLLEDYRIVSNYREYVVGTGYYNGIKITVCSTGIGAPSTEIAVIQLIALGAKALIRIGGTGVLKEEVPCGAMVLNTGAVRRGGSSCFYAPSEYPALASFEVLDCLKRACEEREQPYSMGVCMSVGSFYHGQGRQMPFETGYDENAVLEQYKKWNILNMEMEAETIFTLASLNNVFSGSICAVHCNRITDQWLVDFEPAQKEMCRTALAAGEKLYKEYLHRK